MLCARRAVFGINYGNSPSVRCSTRRVAVICRHDRHANVFDAGWHYCSRSAEPKLFEARSGAPPYPLDAQRLEDGVEGDARLYATERVQAGRLGASASWFSMEGVLLEMLARQRPRRATGPVTVIPPMARIARASGDEFVRPLSLADRRGRGVHQCIFHANSAGSFSTTVRRVPANMHRRTSNMRR